jgi:hypothetical protein
MSIGNEIVSAPPKLLRLGWETQYSPIFTSAPGWGKVENLDAIHHFSETVIVRLASCPPCINTGRSHFPIKAYAMLAGVRCRNFASKRSSHCDAQDRKDHE